MDTFAWALIGWTILIVILESLMWHIFHLKIVRICLPSEMDLSFLRFLTLARIRLFALLHTLLLLGIIFYFFFRLW